MPIIHRYLIKEFLKYFAIVQVAVICIFMAVDYLSRLDKFMEAGITLFRGLVFVSLKIPFMVVQLTPVCSILSVLIVFGIMNRHNEVTALRAGGAGIGHLLKPVIFTGLLFSVMLFTLAEGVVPLTQSAANRINQVEIRKRGEVTTRDTDIWLKGEGRITHIKFYDEARRLIQGVTLSFFNDAFRLVRRVDAREGVFQDGRWLLRGGIEQTLARDGVGYVIRSFDEQPEELDLSPGDLKTVVRSPEEMSMLELYHQIQRVESEGYDATRNRVDLFAKSAFPFVCLIMILLGTGLSVKGKVRGGTLSLSVAYGIGIAFCYWVFHSFCLSLGYGEMLPPILAAWITNVIFLGISAVTLINAEWS